MTQQDYQSALNAIHLAAQMLKAYDLPGMLDEIRKAENAQDPTRWREIFADYDLIRAALPLWRMAGKQT